MTSYFSRWLRHSNKAHRGPVPSRRSLAIEQLETRITPSYTLTTLASFNGTKNGDSPDAVLIMDSSGNLYGTTHWRRRLRRRHRFRAGPGQRHDHHAGFVQRHQRRKPAGRPDHGQQRQSVRHNRRGRRLRATAPFSSWPRAAAPSPRWLRSTAPTVQRDLIWPA